MGVDGLEGGAGARSIIDIMDEPDEGPDEDFAPRVLVLPPRPDPRPRPSWAVDALEPLRSGVPLSASVAFLLVRARREVPPLEPGPRSGRPVS